MTREQVHIGGYGMTDDELGAMLVLKHGNITAAARALNCGRRTIYNRLALNPALRDLIEEQREGDLDDAEELLRDKALRGDSDTLLIFFLKTRGYKRGYGARQEISGPSGGPIDVRDVSDMSLDELVAIATGASAG